MTREGCLDSQVLAVANQKGGVGKTTTTLCLGGGLALSGKKVLVLDLDPQASATMHLRFYPEELDLTLFDLLEKDEDRWPGVWENLILKGPELPFDFVPSCVRLAGLEVDMKDRRAKGELLSRALERVRGDYDYILLDCPPHLGLLQVNALIASTLLVIPIQTDFMALNGLKMLFETIRTLNRVRPRPIRYRALATMFDSRASACRRVLNLLRKKMGRMLFETVVHMDTRFREASAQGKVIFQAFPEARGANEYMLLTREILKI